MARPPRRDATRRRNRVNGHLVEDGAAGLVFEVGQSFGNCPQYIHERQWHRATPARELAVAARSTRLNASIRRWIAPADTLFIGSGHHGEGRSAAYSMDASFFAHAGAPRGIRASVVHLI